MWFSSLCACSRKQSGGSLSRSCATQPPRVGCCTATTAAAWQQRRPPRPLQQLPARMPCRMRTPCMRTTCSRWAGRQSGWVGRPVGQVGRVGRWERKALPHRPAAQRARESKAAPCALAWAAVGGCVVPFWPAHPLPRPLLAPEQKHEAAQPSSARPPCKRPADHTDCAAWLALLLHVAGHAACCSSPSLSRAPLPAPPADASPQSLQRHPPGRLPATRQCSDAEGGIHADPWQPGEEGGVGRGRAHGAARVGHAQFKRRAVQGWRVGRQRGGSACPCVPLACGGPLIVVKSPCADAAWLDPPPCPRSPSPVSRGSRACCRRRQPVSGRARSGEPSLPFQRTVRGGWLAGWRPGCQLCVPLGAWC